MYHTRIPTAAGTLLAATALLLSQSAGRCDPPAQPEGVEVLARGPVHEAYAASVNDTPKAAPLVNKEPPAPIEELPPDQKPEGDNVQWLPGYWAWDEERGDYLWVSGFWRVPPPGRVWTPGHWKQASEGWQWVAGFWAAAEQREMTYLPPPPAPVEAAPSVPAPGADYVYVPGCWVYRETRYVWRPGVWCACRPGWVWVPAHFTWTPCGYVFVEGYWDYPLRERGILFAPVIVDVRVCRRPGWCYSPCYVVHDDCLVSALFVRPGYSCYYFGDYFEPGCRRAGYVSWIDVRVGGGCDPLFSYYRVSYRSTAGWEVGLRAGYAGRYKGDLPRPPRTLVQQNTVVNNVTVNNINNTTTNNVTNNKTVVNNNITMVTALNQVNKNSMKLQPVNAEQRQSEKKSAQQFQQAAQQRNQVETQLLAKGPAPAKLTDLPRTAKLDLPKVAAAAINPAKTPPPPPTRSDAKAPDPKQPMTPAKPEAKPQPTPAPQVAPGKVDPKQPTVPAKPEAKPQPTPAPQAAPGKIDPKQPTPPGKPEAKPQPTPAPQAAPGKVDPKQPTTPARPDGKVPPNPIPRSAPKQDASAPGSPETKSAVIPAKAESNSQLTQPAAKSLQAPTNSAAGQRGPTPRQAPAPDRRTGPANQRGDNEKPEKKDKQ